MTDDQIVALALQITEELALHYTDGPMLTAPAAVRGYLRLKLGRLDHEEFFAVWLSARHAVISLEQIAVGTLTQTTVYPREIVKAALKHNAAAVIFAHNHPSGCTSPSSADTALTNTLTQALALVDVRVLDHFIITPSGLLSMAEHGLI